ncbi:MAG: hypothetical protein EAY75_11620 [Bacteroidetes bacterium]|nr:MAG: hypothetical protein EAY75_11620 [Bacteroidota bacterium]
MRLLQFYMYLFWFFCVAHLLGFCHRVDICAPFEQILLMAENFIFVRPKLLAGFLTKLNYEN